MWWIESNSDNARLSMWDVIRIARSDPMAFPTQARELRSPPPQSSSSHEMGSMDATSCAATVQPTNKGYDPRMLPPTSKLSWEQWIYLLLFQGFASMTIAFTLNFAAAWPMYYIPRSDADLVSSTSPWAPPFLFRLPVSLVADAAVGTIIQSIITWFCLVFVVNAALSRGKLQPYAPERGLFSREPRNGFLRWFLFLDHYNERRGSSVFCCCRSGVPKWIAWVFAGLGRAMIVAVLAYAIMIGPMIGIMVAVGIPWEGDWVFLGLWDGVAYKVTYGSVLGLWMAPALAWMWMLRAGWIVRRHERLPI